MSVAEVSPNHPRKMKKLSLSIFVLGALNASLWIWAPILMRLQARNVFERYGALESLELAVQVFQESMRFTYIAAGFIGAVMLLSAVLLYSRRMAGWHLWVTCLAVNAVGTMVDILRGGMSGGQSSAYSSSLPSRTAPFASTGAPHGRTGSALRRPHEHACKRQDA